MREKNAPKPANRSCSAGNHIPYQGPAPQNLAFYIGYVGHVSNFCNLYPCKVGGLINYQVFARWMLLDVIAEKAIELQVLNKGIVHLLSVKHMH